MTSTRLQRLLTEMCALIGVAYEATDSSGGTLLIAGFEVLLVCDSESPQYAAAYFDLGPLPTEGKETALAQMLEINHGIGPSCKGMLSVDPGSQRVLCVLPFFVDELTTGRAVLDELTAFAKELREGDRETGGRVRGQGASRVDMPAAMCWV